MYSKEQVSKLRQQFWTAFGQYMKPVPGINQQPVNWLNYKTGVRHVFFKMDAGKTGAIIAVELRHSGEAERMACYRQFEAVKNMLHQISGMEWNWEADAVDDHGQALSRISQSINHVNLLNEKDWPAIIAFLKPRIIALDAFWDMVKDAFE